MSAKSQRHLPPALKARAAAVKAAHAHLCKTCEGFRDLPGREQVQRTQAHVCRMCDARKGTR